MQYSKRKGTQVEEVACSCHISYVDKPSAGKSESRYFLETMGEEDREASSKIIYLMTDSLPFLFFCLK